MGHTFLGAWPGGVMTKKRKLRRECEDDSFGETGRRSESEVDPYASDLCRLWEETFQARLDHWVGMECSEPGKRHMTLVCVGSLLEIVGRILVQPGCTAGF